MTDPTTDDVRRWLRDIPELCTLLPDAANTRAAAIEGPRPAPSSRPPLRLDVIDLADERHKAGCSPDATRVDPDRMGVLPYLDTWIRDLEATAIDGDPAAGIPPREPLDPPIEPLTVTGLCSWLTSHLDWAATLPQWDDLAWGLHALHARLRAATHAVRDVEERAVPCPRCGYALQRLPGTKPQWACPYGHQINVQAVTLKQAAKLVGMPLRTLQDWARRPGLLSPIADSPRKRLFDLGEIQGLAAERRLRGTA